MFGKHFELNEQTMPVVEEIGRHMPGGFFIYRAEPPEELLYANEACFAIFGCADLEEFKALTGYTFRGMVYDEDYEAIAASINVQIDDSADNMDYVEYRIVRRDGNSVVFQFKPTPEASEMLKEIGALIYDLKTLGDSAIDKWINTSTPIE